MQVFFKSDGEHLAHQIGERLVSACAATWRVKWRLKQLFFFVLAMIKYPSKQESANDLHNHSVPRALNHLQWQFMIQKGRHDGEELC